MQASAQLPVFVSGTEGYHTYRIPALMVSMDGTVLAFAEGRKHSARDHGRVELVLKRSTDGGNTWGPLQTVEREGRHTIGNPAPVVDRDTGRIWLPFTRDNDRVFLTWSDDAGATWAPRRDITAAVKPPGWRWYATGPGHAIQLRSGRLLVPCDHGTGRLAPVRHHVMHSHVIYSEDHGETWQLGGSLPGRTDECMAAELADGAVYLTVRNSLFQNRRAYATSHDGGVTWSDVRAALPLSGPGCQASVLALGPDAGAVHRLFLSNPASRRRDHMTLKCREDNGRTWRVITLLHSGPSGYSDLAGLPDGVIGCLYERGDRRYYETITLARVPLE